MADQFETSDILSVSEQIEPDVDPAAEFLSHQQLDLAGGHVGLLKIQTVLKSGNPNTTCRNLYVKGIDFLLN